jgi:hypothetical protein
VTVKMQGYEPPTITDLGAFEELTLTSSGKPNEHGVPATGS